MLKLLSALLAVVFVWSATPASAEAPRADGARNPMAAPDVSARRRAHRHRHYHRRHYRVTAYYAPRPFRYYYGPGYRLWWGSPHYHGPQTLMWPYTTAPYPHVSYGFGSW